MKHFLTSSNEVMGIDKGQEFLIQDDWKLLTDEELDLILNPPKTEEQIIKEKIQEANAYLLKTDWVTSYKLKHDVGLELIPLTSSKWDIIKKRESFITYLKGLS